LQAHDVAFTNYSLFTNPTNQTYSLVTNTPAGVALGAEYNTDALGNTRTTWSRGAFEFAGASTNPIISVSPSSANFGTLLTNTTADAVFGVTNSGAGTLTGTASTSVPFTILSGGSYSLTNNQGQNVTVRYSPTTAGTNNGTVTFTGGGGTSAPLIGVATNAPAAQGQTTNSPSTTTNTLTIQNMTVGHAYEPSPIQSKPSWHHATDNHYRYDLAGFNIEVIMNEEYNDKSLDATIGRIESKLDMALERINNHSLGIDSLWKFVSNLQMRVAMIAGGISAIAFLLEIWLQK
jgi:hypothetical protein